MVASFPNMVLPNVSMHLCMRLVAVGYAIDTQKSHYNVMCQLPSILYAMGNLIWWSGPVIESRDVCLLIGNEAGGHSTHAGTLN